MDLSAEEGSSQLNEEEIRQDQRKKDAQELLKLMETSGRAVQAGLWYAATTLDPSLNTFRDED